MPNAPLSHAAIAAATLITLTLSPPGVRSAAADGDLHKVNHVIIVMQENHSFDNYFGALAYAPGSPYHSPRRERGDGDGDGDDRRGCREDDHDCVDGLSCRVDRAGQFHCSNTNLDDDGSTVHAFH